MEQAWSASEASRSGEPLRPRVLVVEDDPSVLVSMQAILQQDGYEVIAAGTGAEAIDWVHRCTFDLVLADLRIQDTDGLAILAEVQRAAADK